MKSPLTRIHIFRAGTRTPVTGAPISFSEADMAAAAGSYDPALHEAPIVVGHPKMDAPAFGWVSGLESDGPDLHANVGQVDPAFAEMVQGGRFKKVSAQFYLPGSTHNPAPGNYYLKHVGFLGATPPAVKGLKQVSFADEDEADVITVEFAESDWAGWWAMKNMARSMRDMLIEKFGREDADKAIPDYLIDSLDSAADAASDENQPAFSEKPKEQAVPPTPEAAKTDDAADLEAKRKKLEADEAAFAERAAKDRKEKDEALLDALIEDGKPVMGERKAELLAFMETLDDGDTVAFAEGSEKQTSRDWFRGFLKTLPDVVAFGEHGAPEKEDDDDVASFAAPEGFEVDQDRLKLDRKAQAYAAKNSVSYGDALKAVS